MSKELSEQLGPQAVLATAPVVRQSSSIRAFRTAGIVLAGSAFVAACAHVSLPLYFTPVPLSMAPFAVLVIGLLLSPRLAAATLGTYLAEGAMGLPVFAPIPLATGGLAHSWLAHPGLLYMGLAHLAGPTGGYLLAYPLAAVLIAFLVRQTDRGFASALLSAAAGSLVILFCGGLWLAALTHASAQSVFTLAVLPFLPGDALKVAAAAGLASGWVRLRRGAA